jgi:coenzyme PQQ precursor peptide PqqA
MGVWFIAAMAVRACVFWIRGLKRPSKRSSLQRVGPRRGHPILDGILPNKEEVMKVWSKPAVREQEVGLEVTSYMPAEIDII